MDNFDCVASSYCYQCSFAKNYPNCQMECIQKIEKVFSQSNNVSALIIEPILGSAGNIVPPYEYFQKSQELCNKYNVLLIVDEVATGIGRTGKILVSDLFDLNLDVLILSKGLNAGYLLLGAVLFYNPVLSVFAKKQIIIPHGSTRDGNPFACSVALATLKYIEKENIVNNVQKVGEYLLSLLRTKL